MSEKWRQHVLCTRLIRQHPDWDDERVLQEAGMRKPELDVVAEARREVENEKVQGNVTWKRSY